MRLTVLPGRGRGLLFAVLTIAMLIMCLMPAKADPSALMIDSDRDGLEDVLEAELRTSPKAADTDYDGLTDYDEYCKYRTDPTKADSDGDGKKDNDANERREYAYTVKAICEIRPPCDPSTMTDLFQDVRVLKPGRLPDSKIVEMVIYPFSTPHIFPGPYKPDQALPEKLRPYIQRTLAMNYSPEMQAEVREIVKNAKSDVEAVETILRWIATETRLDNTEPEFAYFCVQNNQVKWHHPKDSPAAGERLLHSNFYGDSMFKSRLHGTCTSLASLRGTMFRAAGIPTRFIQTLPLITRYEGDPEPLTDKIRKRLLADGYILSPTSGGANHAYNEVFLANHWIRVDDVIGRGTFVGSKIFAKVFSAPDWNNLFHPRPAEEAWNERRDMRPLEVADALPRYKSEGEFIDVAVEPGDLAVGPESDGRWGASVSIRNKGTLPSPEFSIYFYAGDPGRGGRLLTQHGAGPIMPGNTWSEGSGPLDLKAEEDTVFVVLDSEGSVREKDEANNKASVTLPALAPDLAIDAREISFRPSPNGWQASAFVHNLGRLPSPEVSVLFYAGDPDKGGRLLSSNGAGVIMPGGRYGEAALNLELDAKEKEVFVVVDPEDRAKESNESNNKASASIPND